jgi:hypothetical protein
MLGGILIGAAGSILAVILIALAARTRISLAVLGHRYKLADVLRRGGISRFHLSRDDYGRSLRTYLSQAKHSIRIISVSLKLTHDEGDLADLFRSRLAENPNFRVSVSLLAPSSSAAQCAASSLNLEAHELRREIMDMVRTLLNLKSTLPSGQRERLDIRVHECFPMGSAIMLDAGPENGIIQIETKLHRSPRVESFGFEICGPSDFYKRHYRAWTRVWDESREPVPAEYS